MGQYPLRPTFFWQKILKIAPLKGPSSNTDSTIFCVELPGPAAGPPGERELPVRAEQDEPAQPRHLLRARPHARH